MQAGVDALSWAIAVILAVGLRFEFDSDAAIAWAGVLLVAILASVLQVTVGYWRKLYRGRYVYGSFDEVRGVTETVLVIVTALLALAALSTPRVVPLSVSVIAGVIALVAMLASRYVVRLRRDAALRPGDDAEPVVLFFGAGGGASALADDPARPSQPLPGGGNPRRRPRPWPTCGSVAWRSAAGATSSPRWPSRPGRGCSW